MEVTALQQYIDWLSNEFDPDEMQLKAHELLIVEKQQIIDAYNQGDIQLVNAEQYYNETYKPK